MFQLAYLEQGDYNIIITDWVQARTYSYTVAAKVTEHVGSMASKLLRELDADFSNVHAIGFGLGAVSSHNNVKKICWNLSISNDLVKTACCWRHGVRVKWKGSENHRSYI